MQKKQNSKPKTQKSSPFHQPRSKHNQEPYISQMYCACPRPVASTPTGFPPVRAPRPSDQHGQARPCSTAGRAPLKQLIIKKTVAYFATVFFLLSPRLVRDLISSNFLYRSFPKNFSSSLSHSISSP